MASYPLTSIQIRGFRGLRDVRLDGLGRVNLIVGGTNSGKTSVLEALSLLEGPLDPMVWHAVATRREPPSFGSLTSSKVDRLRYLFAGAEAFEDGPAQFEEIQLNVEGSVPLSSLTARMTELRGLRPEREALLPSESGEPQDVESEVERTGLAVMVSVDTGQQTLFEKDNSRTFEVWEGESVREARRRTGPGVKCRVVTSYDHWFRHPATTTFSEAVRTGQESAVLELLRQLEPRIVDVKVLVTQKEPALYLKDARAGYLPLSSFGDGIRRVLTLALALPRAAGGMLLVDEIETGIHVSMLRKVYEWLVTACHRYDVQLFATTHSIEAVDAMLEADTTQEEDTVGFRLEAGPDGPVARRFGETQLRRLRERGLEIR